MTSGPEREDLREVSPDEDSAAEQPSAAEQQAAAEPAEMTPEERGEAREYGRKQLVLRLIDRAVDLAFLAVLALVAARPLDAWLAAWLRGDTLRLVGLFVVSMALNVAVSLPISFYGGYVLEHRYGLSRQSLPRWLWRKTKMLALSLLLGTGLVVGLYWTIWLCGAWWWLVAAGGFFLVSVVLGQLVPVLILPLFYKIERLDDADLMGRMQRLAEGTGLAIEGAYRIVLSAETVKANAMLTGLGRTRRVLLGDTLLESFSHDEIEVVLAHEVGHHVHRHIPKMIVTGAVTSAAGFWVCDWIVTGWVGGWSGAVDRAQLPVYALPMFLLVLTVLSTILEPLQNTVSRFYERQCDRYALRRTGLREAYVAVFQKLARLNKADPDPPRLEVALFHSHPAIAQRIRMAEGS